MTPRVAGGADKTNFYDTHSICIIIYIPTHKYLKIYRQTTLPFHTIKSAPPFYGKFWLEICFYYFQDALMKIFLEPVTNLLGTVVCGAHN